MIDLMALIQSWYRGRGKDRFETANPTQQVFSPFDIPSELLEDMLARNVKPFHVQTISLATAGEMELNIPGFHVVIYGHDGSTNKAVNTTAYIEMFWDHRTQDMGFPLKHARGYSGVFRSLYLKWPAQANVYVDIVVHSGMHQQWIDGESCT